MVNTSGTISGGVFARCPHCFGDHDPDECDYWVEFNGERFTPPFRCLCCGKETCARQFAWGRACGLCDTGACQTGSKNFRPEYAHAPYQRVWVRP